MSNVEGIARPEARLLPETVTPPSEFELPIPLIPAGATTGFWVTTTLSILPLKFLLASVLGRNADMAPDLAWQCQVSSAFPSAPSLFYGNNRFNDS